MWEILIGTGKCSRTFYWVFKNRRKFASRKEFMLGRKKFVKYRRRRSSGQTLAIKIQRMQKKDNRVN